MGKLFLFVVVSLSSLTYLSTKNEAVANGFRKVLDGKTPIEKFQEMKDLIFVSKNRTVLATLRGTIRAYVADNEGRYPERLLDLVPKYIKHIDSIKIPPHELTDQTEVYGQFVINTVHKDNSDLFIPTQLKDTGRFAYLNAPGMAEHGHIFIDCTHTDSNGKVWWSY